MQNDDALTKLREDIDRVNKALIALFEERMDISESIAKVKQERGLPIFDVVREREVLSSTAELVQEQGRDDALALMRTLMELSKRRQKRALSEGGNPLIDEAKARFEADKFADLLGITQIEVTEGFARASMKITDEMLNGAGVANGGVAYALADYALALAANTVSTSNALTLNMNISYLRPAMLGDTLTAEGTVQSRPGRVMTVSAYVYNQSRELIATAQGNTYAVSQK